ncbi:alpha-L-fucosidase [Rhodopirellula sallentina]|uniref:alpha-L-fucosidase n=1 Tax=Rhodopirellula sallentina SM41 TaxID=1263870 RepID=M5TYE2_9BACT|nr:alpha-L-fucosidase [Rhodopirellula sallentina]EMI54222.1 Glycoside hydrolase, family 29 [Rhodopirellula sallentina SM41]
MMKSLLTLSLLASIGLPTLAAAPPDPFETLAREKAERPWFARFMSGDPVVSGFPGESEADFARRVQKWKDAKFGLFLHWGPQQAGGEYVIKPAELAKFNPVKFDAEEWVLTAKKIGFQYIVITTKHHAGFCMFDSKYTDHDIIDATPFGRDPIKELADACAKHNMLLGFYYSVWDIKHPDYAAEIRGPRYASYHQYMLDQTEELLTNYGDVATLWMDGEWVNSWTYERASQYRDHVRKLQPGILLVDRIGQRRLGDGDYGSCENFTPYIGDNINGRLWESCQRFDGGWFWRGKDTSQSFQWALMNLVDTVSRGGNLLLNMGPTPEGLLPPKSVEKLQPLSQWLQKYGESIYGVDRGPHYLLDWGTCTRRDNTLYYHVTYWPTDGKLIIPGLNAEQPNAGISQVTFLGDADASPLRFSQNGRDVVVSVPSKSVDPLVSVLKVELTSPPVVDNAIRPLGRALRPQTGNAKMNVGDYFLSSAFAKIYGDDLHFSLGAGAGGHRENLKGWTNPSDWAEWEIIVDEAGAYDVLINYSSWMDSGKFSVEVASQSFEHAVEKRVHKKGRKSPFAAAFKTVPLGQVKFTQPGRYLLSVKALEIDPKAIEYAQGLMLLREVILVPVQ